MNVSDPTVVKVWITYEPLVVIVPPVLVNVFILSPPIQAGLLGGFRFLIVVLSVLFVITAKEYSTLADDNVTV